MIKRAGRRRGRLSLRGRCPLSRRPSSAARLRDSREKKGRGRRRRGGEARPFFIWPEIGALNLMARQPTSIDDNGYLRRTGVAAKKRP